MIYKLISTQEVIAKIFADLDIKEDAQRVSDMIEWISEAVEKIGAVSQLKRLVSGAEETPYLEIRGYQAKMPNNLYRLNGVQYSNAVTGPWIDIKKSTAVFNMFPTVESIGQLESINESTLIDLVKTLYNDYVDEMSYQQALSIINTNQNIRTILVNLINGGNVNSRLSVDGFIKYYIKPGYIVFNIESGFAKIAYDALQVDENGYMMIPDLASYKEAVYWYVVMKLKYPEYLSGRMNREIYYDIRRSWNFYCKQAYGEAMMPDADDMENIRSEWVRLLPNPSASKSYFNSIEDEYIYNS